MTVLSPSLAVFRGWKTRYDDNERLLEIERRMGELQYDGAPYFIHLQKRDTVDGDTVIPPPYGTWPSHLALASVISLPLQEFID